MCGDGAGGLACENVDNGLADKNISELYLGKSKGILGRTERSGDGKWKN